LQQGFRKNSDQLEFKTHGKATYHLSDHHFIITLKSGGCLLQDGCKLLAVSTPGGIEFNKNCDRKKDMSSRGF
jgi:hypothetical protein